MGRDLDEFAQALASHGHVTVERAREMLDAAHAEGRSLTHDDMAELNGYMRSDARYNKVDSPRTKARLNSIVQHSPDAILDALQEPNPVISIGDAYAVRKYVWPDQEAMLARVRAGDARTLRGALKLLEKEAAAANWQSGGALNDAIEIWATAARRDHYREAAELARCHLAEFAPRRRWALGDGTPSWGA